MRYKFTADSVINDRNPGARQIRVVASDPTPDRVGDIMVPQGCDLSNYRRNPIVLANHDSTKPIGTAAVSISGSQVLALITFAGAGASRKADEYCALAKEGVISAVSVGFDPVEYKPNDNGGRTYIKWELLELSLVAVPCNPSAVVVERSINKVGREISAANTAKLRQAHDHADQCRMTLADMLGGVDEPNTELAAGIAALKRNAVCYEDDPECERRRRIAKALRLAASF